MLEERLSPPAVRTTVQLDLRPLHAALARAETALDVLEICEATAMGFGGGLWVAACVRPHARTFVCGPEPVPDDVLQNVVVDMTQTVRRNAAPEGAHFARGMVTRWRNRRSAGSLPCTKDYAQLELTAGGAFYGLLRATSGATEHSESCDWEAIESVMCAASAHIVVCLQRETERCRVDPLTGLFSPTEIIARVEAEVERARTHPTEMSLVALELQLGQHRAPGILTDSELSAVGHVIRRSLRAADCAGRMPDGRFALLLPMTTQRNALIACARTLDMLRTCPDLPDDIECQTGVSGWSFEGASAPELFEQATLALEEAKSAGARGAFVFI